MTNLKNPWQVIGKIALLVGLSFFVLSAIYFVCMNYFDKEIFAILSLVLVLSGVIWFTLGAVFSFVSLRLNAKLERLKREGTRYNAEVTSIALVQSIRIGGYLTVSAECVYHNQDNEACLVKSAKILLNRLYDKKELCAVVYVSRDNPRDYAVELSVAEGSQGSIKHDYR